MPARYAVLLLFLLLFLLLLLLLLLAYDQGVPLIDPPRRWTVDAGDCTVGSCASVAPDLGRCWRGARHPVRDEV